MGTGRVASTLALVAVLVAGCFLGTRGDVSSAQRLASEYLRALTGESGDRGWSLILPDSRRAYASQEQYTELVQEADWSAFTWHLAGGGDYCEDGGVYCVVRVHVDNAPESIPDFLLAAPRSHEEDTLRTMRYDDDESSPGNIEIVVYFTPGGPRGISLGGG